MVDQPSPAEQIAEYFEQTGEIVAAPTTTSPDPFFTYDRPELFGIHIEKVAVPMRDGVSLIGELHRPARSDGGPAEGQFPGIVYEFNGYGAVSFMAMGARAFVSRGYAVLVCSVRGSGDSPGEIDPFGPQEQRDNVDLIEWLATQPFCSGKVGQMGVSYGGHNSALAAVNDAPHLVSVIAIQAFSDWYDNTIYRGGVPNAQIRQWQTATAPATLETYPEHPSYDDYWRERSVRARWATFTVPALIVGGWDDPYRGGMVETVEALPRNTWMVAGPWSHGMVPGQREDIATAGYLAWWDRWLADDRDGLLPQSRVTTYEMPESGWRQFEQWPPRNAHGRDLVLTADGSALFRESDSVGSGEVSFAARGGKAVFDSPKLGEDVVVAGTIDARVEVVFGATQGVVAVILEDIAPDGSAVRVANGWLLASHRSGSSDPKPVDPDGDYVLVVKLWPTHFRFAAKHHIRVIVASEDYPLIDDVAPNATVTVRCGGQSYLRLPALDVDANI